MSDRTTVSALAGLANSTRLLIERQLSRGRTRKAAVEIGESWVEDHLRVVFDADPDNYEVLMKIDHPQGCEPWVQVEILRLHVVDRLGRVSADGDKK